MNNDPICAKCRHVKSVHSVSVVGRKTNWTCPKHELEHLLPPYDITGDKFVMVCDHAGYQDNYCRTCDSILGADNKKENQ